jgi:thymidylate synthase
MYQVYSKTPGEAWVRVCRLVMERGEKVRDEDLTLKELLSLFLSVENPSIEDEILIKYGNHEEREWMRRLWLETKPLPATGRFPALEESYGRRIFDIHGENHLGWIVNKLKNNPDTKSATISTLFPGEKTKTNISCVTTLDFKIRGKKLITTVFVRSQDAYKKLQWDILFLGQIAETVAEQAGVAQGPLNSFVVSEHIYEIDFKEVEKLLAQQIFTKR